MNIYRHITLLLFTFLALYCHYTVPSAGGASVAQAAGAGQTAIAREPLTMFGVPASVIAAAAAGKGAHSKPIHNGAMEQSPLSLAFKKYYPRGMSEKYRTELLDRIYCQEDEPTHTMKFSYKDRDGSVVSLAWSPDSRSIAIGLYPNLINRAYIFDAQTGQKKLLLPHESGRLDASAMTRMDVVGFSHDCKTAFTGSMNGKACIWDAQTGEKKGTLVHGIGIRSIALNPDASRILTAADDHTACVWNAQTHEKLLTFNHSAWVQTASWSHDATRILTGSDDGTACIWNAQTGEKIYTLAHGAKVHTAVWSPDSRSVITGGENRKACMWDSQTGKKIWEGETGQYYTHAQWSADGNLLIMVSGENCASLYDLKKGTEIKLNHRSHVSSAALSADSKYALTGSWDGTVCIWDVQTGSKKFTLTMPMELRGFREFVSRAAWSPDLRWVATKSDNYSVNMWDVSHLTDPKVHAECKAFKEGTLHPAQYMLLALLEGYSKEAHAKNEKWRKEKNPKAAQSILQQIMELSQEQAPGASLKHAIDTLMMFGTALRRSILKSYAIDEAKLVFALAKEKLFEENQQSAQTAPSKPLLQGDTVEITLREYLLGVYETAHDTEQREKAEQTRKENQAFQTQVALAQKWEREKDIQATALTEAIKDGNIVDVQNNLTPATINLRTMEKLMRTPLMQTIVLSAQGHNDYNAIFDRLLNFKRETLLEGKSKVVRESDLAVQDLDFNTPLMLALKMKRFDYALKIAQKMDAHAQWHKAFTMKDKDGQTVDALLEAEIVKVDANNNALATTMAQLQSIIVKHRK